MININVLNEEAMKSFGRVFVERFDGLLDKIVDPIFIKRFSKRLHNLHLYRNKTEQAVIVLEDKKQCTAMGQDCLLAIGALSNLLKKFHAIFSVFSMDLGPSSNPELRKWDRNIGTLISNFNFLVDSKYELAWDTLRKDASSPMTETDLTNYVARAANYIAQATQPDFALVGLQNDLTKLLSRILPAQTISVTDMVGLLGFSETFGTTTTFNCSYSHSNEAMACRKLNELKVAKDLHPLHGFDVKSHTVEECDFGLHLARWLDYWRNLPTIPKARQRKPNHGI